MSHKIFVDESSQSGHPYMIIGGCVVNHRLVDSFTGRVLEIRGRSNNTLKWTNVKKKKLDRYKELVNLTFDLIESNHLHLHTMIVQCGKIDHITYSDGDVDKGFNKFIYQLLLHKVGRRYSAPIEAYVDSRSSRQSMDELRAMLNNGLKQWSVDNNPFALVRFIKYRKAPATWPVDIVIGAIGFYKNGHREKEGAAEYKKELASLVCDRAKVGEHWPNTYGKNRKFSVWNFQLGERGTGTR